MMKRLHTLALTCFLSATVLASPFAAAHATMKSSSPAAGSTVVAPVNEIVLNFNEKLEQSFSSATVQGPDGVNVATTKAQVDAANPLSLRLAVPALAAGQYTVQWIAVGRDGHRRNGDFKFAVK
jgi:methionine-rich copper-binding protein CopC